MIVPIRVVLTQKEIDAGRREAARIHEAALKRGSIHLGGRVKNFEKDRADEELGQWCEIAASKATGIPRNPKRGIGTADLSTWIDPKGFNNETDQLLVFQSHAVAHPAWAFLPVLCQCPVFTVFGFVLGQTLIENHDEFAVEMRPGSKSYGVPTDHPILNDPRWLRRIDNRLRVSGRKQPFTWEDAA